VNPAAPAPAAPRLSLFRYNAEQLAVADLDPAADFRESRPRHQVTWINVDGAQDPDLVARLGRAFDLHPLVLEDLVHTHQRPKIEDYDDYLFIVLKMLSWDAEASLIRSEQVGLVVGRNYVLSFQEADGRDVFGPVRERLRGGKGLMRRAGTDYLAYALLDAVVDNYFTILEELGERVESLEDRLIADPRPEMVPEIHHLRRETIYLRRSVWPFREVAAWLERGESRLIHKATRVYLRDLYDHTVRAMEATESLRETLAALMELYLTGISNRLNGVMKILTIIATIFIPLTFLAGLWGMNFTHMPELDEPWGYPAALGLMLGLGLTMALLFKRKKWW